MSDALIEATELRAGARILYREVVCTVLADAEPTEDRFGQSLLSFEARREDTGQIGSLVFGPHGVVEVTR